jgi:DNA-binding response OmpR family regulator
MSNAGHHILILDDDADIGIMIKTMLEYKGYSVIVADRAEKAEEIFRTNNINLLIMDMLLSGINGTDLCMELKQNPLTSSIPVMMISAHPNAKEICINAGADDFISKPFDMRDMLEKISRLISSARKLQG